LSLSANTLSEQIKSAYYANANAIMIFTTQDIINGGSYKIRNEIDLSIYYFPYTHQFESDSKYYNFFVNTGIGYSHYKEQIKLHYTLPNDIARIDTYAFRLGGGVRFNTDYNLSLILGTSFIYSHLEGSYDYNSINSIKAIKPLLDNFVNNNHDSYTYEITLALKYHYMFGNYKTYVESEISYFDTKESAVIKNNLDSQSSYFNIKGGVISPKLFNTLTLPTKVELYAKDVILSGTIADNLSIKDYYILGSTFHLDISKTNNYFSELYIDFNIAKGNDIEGYNFGIGASF